MMLHIVNQSPFDNNTLDDCLRVAGPHCSLLFIENGVYALLGFSETQKQLINDNHISVFFLEADIEARGLRQKCSDKITLVNDQEFVNLVIQHHSNQSWF